MNAICSKRERVIGLIPARGGSKGIQRKNIVNVDGRPLIDYSIQAALNSKIDEVYVSSEDSEILNISEKLGARTLKRPQELAQDDTSTYAVLEHAYQVLEKPGVIICLQPTSPLRTSKHINEALNLLTQDVNTVVSVCASKDFIWTHYLGKVTPAFSERKRRQDMEASFVENGAIYITRSLVYKSKDSRLGMGISSEGNVRLYVMDEQHGMQIDSPLDLSVIGNLIKNRKGIEL